MKKSLPLKSTLLLLASITTNTVSNHFGRRVTSPSLPRMKKSIFVVLLLCANLLAAQNNKFSISGKISHSPIHNNVSIVNFPNNQSLTQIDGTSYQRTYFSADYEITEIFNSKLGYELIGNFRIRLRSRLNLKTGLGLNYTAFNFSRSSKKISTKITRTEIVDIPIPNPPATSPCDVYTNSYSDIDNLQEGIDFHILSLKLPVEIEYEVLPNKLNLGLGIFAQTPLFSTKNIDYRDIHIETQENGETTCEFFRNTDKDRSDDHLNKLQLGLSWNMNYRITNNIGALLGVTKEFNNLFTDDKIYDDRLPREFNPLKIHVGFEFGF